MKRNITVKGSKPTPFSFDFCWLCLSFLLGFLFAEILYRGWDVGCLDVEIWLDFSVWAMPSADLIVLFICLLLFANKFRTLQNIFGSK